MRRPPTDFRSQLDDLEAGLTGIVTAFVRLRERRGDDLAESLDHLKARTRAFVRKLDGIETGKSRPPTHDHPPRASKRSRD